VDPDLVLYPFPSKKDPNVPTFANATPLIRKDPKSSADIWPYTDRFLPKEGKWTYCRIKIGHDVEHEAFQDSEFVEMVKHLSLAIDVSGIQAPHTMSVGWFFASNVITPSKKLIIGYICGRRVTL
jgi:hypothetical protein